MIIINLQPEHLRPIKRTPLPHIASLAVLALAVLAMLAAFTGVQSSIGTVNKELLAKEAELRTLESVVSQYNDLSRQKEELETKVGVIKDILSDRLIWSEQLQRLISLTPDNIWYSGIQVTVKRVKEQVEDIDPKTNKPIIDKRTQKPKMKNVQVNKRILEVTGYAIENDEGVADAGPLTQATTSDPDFSAMFELLPSTVKDTEFKGYPVKGFTLQYQIDLGGAS
jgi:hypothetical protein